MKKNKLFLVATDEDLTEDRMAIADLIGTLNDKYEEKELYFQLVKPKTAPTEKELLGCEMAFILWFHQSDEITAASFEQALAAFQKSGKPKIITYFKQSDGLDVADDIGGFMERLDKELGHYYNLYEHIDSLRFSLLMQMSALESSISLACKNGDVLLEGEKYISLYEVPCAAKNTALTNLQTQLKKATAKFFELRELHADNEDDEAITDQYIAASEQRNDLRKQVVEMEKNILSASLSMARDVASGTLSDRQREAYRLFEMGDYEGANAVLNFDEIKEDIKHTESALNTVTSHLCVSRNELLQKAKLILACETDSKKLWNGSYHCLQEAVRLEEKYNLPKQAMRMIVRLLMNYGKNQSALEQCEKLIKYLELQEDEHIPIEEIQVLMVELERRQGLLAKSDKRARKLLQEWKEPGYSNVHRRLSIYLPNLCLILANTNLSTGCWKDAKDFCNMAVSLSEPLSKAKREEIFLTAALTLFHIVLTENMQDIPDLSKEAIRQIEQGFTKSSQEYAGYQIISQYLQGKYCWLLHRESEAWTHTLSAHDLLALYGSHQATSFFAEIKHQVMIQLAWIGYQTDRPNCLQYIWHRTYRKEVWSYPNSNPYIPMLLYAKSNVIAALLLQKEQSILDDRFDLIGVADGELLSMVKCQEEDCLLRFEIAKVRALIAEWCYNTVTGDCQDYHPVARGELYYQSEFWVSAIHEGSCAIDELSKLCDQYPLPYLGAWIYAQLLLNKARIRQSHAEGEKRVITGKMLEHTLLEAELQMEMEKLWNPIILQPLIIEWMLMTSESFQEAERNFRKARKWLDEAKRQLALFVTRVEDNNACSAHLTKQAAAQEMKLLSARGGLT